MAVPLLVVTYPPGAWLADYQGLVDPLATYQTGQIVSTAGSNFWSALKLVPPGEAPEQGSPFWGFLGNAEAVVTKAFVEEAQEAAEAAATVIAGGGTWTAPESLAAGAKEKAAPAPKLDVRTESANNAARLRGGVTMEAGKEVKAGVTLLTLPAGFRPTATEVFAATDAAGTLRVVTIAASGVVSLGTDLKEAQTVNLDGIAFPTT